MAARFLMNSGGVPKLQLKPNHHHAKIPAKKINKRKEKGMETAFGTRTRMDKKWRLKAGRSDRGRDRREKKGKDAQNVLADQSEQSFSEIE